MSGLISENSIIRLLRDRYGVNGPLIKEGIGDDAAVIRTGKAEEYLLITTDMLLEGIDFRREWITPRCLGCKSIAVNLSDLAAMGARPLFFTVSLAVPADISKRWILDFYDGLTDPRFAGRARLIGGDFSRAEAGIAISITALGESVNRKVLYRKGGRAGDLLYVTGTLGQSAAGLRLLESGCIHPKSRAQKEAIRVHQSPEARWKAGMWLAQSGLVRCMMDLSDGLSTDLPRLCAASGVGAEVRVADLPVFRGSRLWGCNPDEMALNGGEDFELLFSVPKSKGKILEEKYPAGFPKITKIGTMTRDIGKMWLLEPGNNRRPLVERGYDHFSR
ncbi:MAG TPA: thiamine-phosphate kinase [Acidobacteriota bacterium]|nr:thiamine-phosphate kinase [Acidobacteriota bacterium]